MRPIKLEHIGVFTSGGDAPGMNAAIRAVVRTAIANGLKVSGIIQGYQGMLENHFIDLDSRKMANIIQRGGTMLKTGRSKEFLLPEYRQKAVTNLLARGVRALVCIGGDGSLQGAHALFQEHGMAVIGIPGTIDNDVYGSDSTIGFDTAVNTALDAIDKIRDTAASHDRLFIVEVMGRDSGFIATDVGIAGGAEAVLFPDNPVSLDAVINKIQKAQTEGKLSSILVTAEGQKPGRAYDLAETLRKRAGLDAKVCILGHIQRGGSPTARDRILASILGASAVNALIAGKTDIMIGTNGNDLVEVPLSNIGKNHRAPNQRLIELIKMLSL